MKKIVFRMAMVAAFCAPVLASPAHAATFPEPPTPRVNTAQLTADALIQRALDDVLNWNVFAIDSGGVTGAVYRAPHVVPVLNGGITLSPGGTLLLGSLAISGRLFSQPQSPSPRGNGVISIGGSLQSTGADFGVVTMGSLAGSQQRIVVAGLSDPHGRNTQEGHGGHGGYGGNGGNGGNHWNPHGHGNSHHWNHHGHGGDGRHWNFGHDNDWHRWGYPHHGAGGNGGNGGGYHWNFEYCEITPSVPEPETYVLIGLGLLAIWIAKRRRKPAKTDIA